MHKGGVMKRSFSAVNALKLGLHALRQNLLRSVATVALLAVCATAFGVFSSTLLDYGRKQEQLFALNPSATFALSKFDWSNYAVGQESLLEISSRLGFYASNAVVSFSADEISRLEARTGASFARIYYDPGMQTPVVGGDISRPAHWFWYADYDRRESLLAWNACVTELAGTEEAARNEYDLAYLAGQAAHRNGVDHFLDSEAYARSLAIACLPEEDIAGFGCSMLAGRMPQAADEIAVSECFYREFEARGYCLYDDIAAGEMIVPVYNDRYAEGYDPAKPDGYILNIDEIPSREEALVARIAAPEDLLGKALAVYGAGEGVAPGGSYRLMRVVGVVDTGCSYERFMEQETQYPWRMQEKLFVSAAWVEENYPAGGVFALSAPRNGAPDVARACLDLHQHTLDMLYELPVGSSLPAQTLVMVQEPVDVLMEAQNGVFRQLRVILSALGAVFGIFGVLLSYALTSASVEKERREIGILKSLGAKDRDIYRIFLAESLIVGLCVFCVALAATCGIVYGVFGGFLVQGASVMLMQVGVWQVLLLLAISLAVPTGMGALSVRQMLRASPVEIMRAKDRRKKPARQRGI